MNTTPSPKPPAETRRGRPRRASRELLQDAAFELFLEQGYQHTTIDEITNRAGVSRNTFFNYFEAKGDVFWPQVDAAIVSLAERLTELRGSTALARGLEHVLSQSMPELESSPLPWMLANAAAIGAPAEIRLAGAERVHRASVLIRSSASARLNLPEHDVRIQLLSNHLLATALAAIVSWAAAGAQRGSLSDTFLAAIELAETQ